MSARALRITLIVLALLGLAVASYVTYVHYAGIKPACTAGESCTKVQTSRYAEIAGVPVALIGLIGYVAILGSLLAPDEERFRFLTAALTLGGFGFSVYLTYREVFSIHAICEECLSSAIIMTIMMCLSIYRYLRADTGAATHAGSPADEPQPEPATPPLGAAQS
jgi:uncharacterized membrane protein